MGMFAKSPESFALAPEPELEWDATMDVRGLTRDLHLLGADYSLPDGARGGPAADAPLLRGRVDTPPPEIAVRISDALVGVNLALARGRLVGLWFLRAQAQRLGQGAVRRIDLRFKARVEA